MLNKYKEIEIARLNNSLSMIEDDIDHLSADLEEIDEKYRKLAEEEKADTKATIEYYEQRKQFYEEQLAVLTDGETVAPVEPEKKPRKKREKKEEVPAPPQDATEVVDTIYPENNESEDTTEEPMPDLPEPVEETNASSGSLFDFPEDPSSAPEEETEAPAEPVIEDDWSTPKDTVVENEPVDLDDFAMPEEWK